MTKEEFQQKFKEAFLEGDKNKISLGTFCQK